MSTPLEIVVTGNTSGAESELKKVQTELGKTAIAAQKTDSSLDNFSKTLQRIGTSGGQSIAVLQSRLDALKGAVLTERDASQIGKFNKQIQVTETEISRLSNIGKSGFDNLGNSIEKTGNPLTKAFSSLRQIAYILPGIGVAGLLGGLIEGVIKFASSIETAVGATITLADKQKATNEVFKDSSSAYVKAVSNVEELRNSIQLAKEGFVSKDEVVKHYNETIGKTTGLVTNITEAESELNSKAADFIRFSLLKAAANEALAKSAKATLDALVVSKQQPKDFESGLDAFTRNLEDVLGAPGLFGGGGGVEKFQSAFSGATKEAKTFDEVYKDLIKQADDLAKKDGFNIFSDTTAAAKAKETIESVIKKMREDIEVLNKTQIAFGTNEALAKVKKLEDTVVELFKKFKLDPENKIVLGLEFEANDIKEREALRKLLPELKKTAADNPLEIPTTITPPKPLTPKDIAPAFDKTKKEIDDLNQHMADGLKSTLNDSLAGIGEGIGDAISGGKNIGEAVFGNLFQVLASGITQLGKELIELGTIKVAIEKFRFAPGLGTVAIGIAAVALGSILQHSIPKFAGGVTNFSGGVALVGERGPELVTLPRGSNVIPNNQLGGSNNVQVFIPEVKLRGDHLLLVFNQAQASKNRFT